MDCAEMNVVLEKCDVMVLRDMEEGLKSGAPRPREKPLSHLLPAKATPVQEAPTLKGSDAGALTEAGAVKRKAKELSPEQIEAAGAGSSARREESLLLLLVVMKTKKLT